MPDFPPPTSPARTASRHGKTVAPAGKTNVPAATGKPAVPATPAGWSPPDPDGVALSKAAAGKTATFSNNLPPSYNVKFPPDAGKPNPLIPQKIPPMPPEKPDGKLMQALKKGGLPLYEGHRGDAVRFRPDIAISNPQAGVQVNGEFR